LLLEVNALECFQFPGINRALDDFVSCDPLLLRVQSQLPLRSQGPRGPMAIPRPENGPPRNRAILLNVAVSQPGGLLASAIRAFGGEERFLLRGERTQMWGRGLLKPPLSQPELNLEDMDFFFGFFLRLSIKKPFLFERSLP
jgi:hypothetical protein